MIFGLCLSNIIEFHNFLVLIKSATNFKLFLKNNKFYISTQFDLKFNCLMQNYGEIKRNCNLEKNHI